MPAGQRKLQADADAVDPVLALAQRWISSRNAQELLEREWQDAEHQLSLKIRPLGLNLEEAERSDLPEARVMRALMRRIQAADRSLDRESRRIGDLRPNTPAGALAKIDVALRMHHPAACEERVWLLLTGAVEELREQLSAPAPPARRGLG